MEQPLLLYVLPTYGHFPYARRCAETLRKYTSDRLAIAVIDDASEDWDDVDWAAWPKELERICVHFKTNDGLTRSWNLGLQLAREMGAEYTICGNSDVLFTPGWLPPLVHGLDIADLIGPVTNAPGHCDWQDARNYGLKGIHDDAETLERHAGMLAKRRVEIIRANRINGFFMMARTATWWSEALDDETVFDPRYRLTGNEDELQKRWLKHGKRLGYVPRSYIFHYRSVSRHPVGAPLHSNMFRPEQPL